MKNVFLLYLLMVSLTSCDFLFGGENFPPEPDIEHYTVIQNNSSYRIEVHLYRNGQVYHIKKLDLNEKWEIYNEIFEEQIPFSPDEVDSSRVVYDSVISVVNTKEEPQDVSRSIWLRSSYTGGKVNDKLYEIYYTFTDTDYEEAVALNGGG